MTRTINHDDNQINNSQVDFEVYKADFCDFVLKKFKNYHYQSILFTILKVINQFYLQFLQLIFLLINLSLLSSSFEQNSIFGYSKF